MPTEKQDAAAKATGKPKKYRIAITLHQETDGGIDGRTFHEDFSDDLAVHAIKTKVLVNELSQAIDRATDRLTQMVLDTIEGSK